MMIFCVSVVHCDSRGLKQTAQGPDPTVRSRTCSESISRFSPEICFKFFSCHFEFLASFINISFFGKTAQLEWECWVCQSTTLVQTEIS